MKKLASILLASTSVVVTSMAFAVSSLPTCAAVEGFPSIKSIGSDQLPCRLVSNEKEGIMGSVDIKLENNQPAIQLTNNGNVAADVLVSYFTGCDKGRLDQVSTTYKINPSASQTVNVNSSCVYSDTNFNAILHMNVVNIAEHVEVQVSK